MRVSRKSINLCVASSLTCSFLLTMGISRFVSADVQFDDAYCLICHYLQGQRHVGAVNKISIQGRCRPCKLNINYIVGVYNITVQANINISVIIIDCWYAGTTYGAWKKRSRGAACAPHRLLGHWEISGLMIMSLSCNGLSIKCWSGLGSLFTCKRCLNHH